MKTPLSLYIHTPWCIKKCPYCDFNSHAHSAEGIPEGAYLSRLIEDIQKDKHWAYDRNIETIFIGGGTPSLLSEHFYKELLEQIAKHLSLSSDAEITMEANPGTVEAERFKGYFQAGINRLSLGVQSFQDEKLTRLGRIHNSSNALNAINVVKEAGFDNFNIDLMHGLPDQSLEDALFDINTALSLEPTHLSWYQLTIEPNTEFFSKPPTLPVEDTLCDIIDAGQQLLADKGFGQYEISAYAKPGKQSRHNLNYWRFGDYLAIGAGAHGKITNPDGSQFRYRKTRQPNHYLSLTKPTTAAIDIIEREALPLEFMMNTLRLTEGFETKLFEERTGLDFSTIEGQLIKATQEQLLKWDNERICPTEKGRVYLNELLERFL
jgi:oxygen-independent coproporphyrinogen-3 oxidase